MKRLCLFTFLFRVLRQIQSLRESRASLHEVLVRNPVQSRPFYGRMKRSSRQARPRLPLAGRKTAGGWPYHDSESPAPVRAAPPSEEQSSQDPKKAYSTAVGSCKAFQFLVGFFSPFTNFSKKK